MIQLNRHCPAILMRKLRRWFEPDLDQQRVARTFEWAIPGESRSQVSKLRS